MNRLRVAIGWGLVALALTACESQPERRDTSMMRPEDRLETVRATSPSTGKISLSTSDEAVVPIVQEELEVQTRKVETGRVRVTKSVHERDVVVHTQSVQEDVHVERVPVDQFIAQPVSIRYEDETMIIPIMEEVPVVVTRLKLKEELRVTKHRTTTPHSQSVRLQSEEVQVERTAPDTNARGAEAVQVREEDGSIQQARP